MNKKQLAEMIKALRKKKMEEQGSIKQQSKDYLENQKFEPIHSPDTYSPKGGTPNDYAHRMEEDVSSGISNQFGHRHRPRKNPFKGRLIPSKRTWQKRGNQTRSPSIYATEEDTEKLGATETKKKTQSVTVTPEIEQFGKQ